MHQLPILARKALNSPWAWALMTSLLFQFVTVTDTFALPPLSAEELIEKTALKSQRETLEKGEIVSISQPERESDTELVVLMATWVPTPLSNTIEELQRQSQEKNAPGVLDLQEITARGGSPEISRQFEKIVFSPSELNEVKKLMHVKPSGAYNFSKAEIDLFRQAAKSIPANATGSSAMTATMRSVMQDRYLSYLANGLDGIPPYQISATKQAHPANELAAATESIKVLKERYPAYYRTLRYFPKQNASGVSHQFFWVKQMEEGRPIFVLKHWLIDIQPEYGIITERQYYLSHSLNSLQVVIGCLPYNKGTLVVLLNQVFTEKVHVTIGKRIAKKVGRTIVEKKVRPIFENLRAVLNK